MNPQYRGGKKIRTDGTLKFWVSKRRSLGGGILYGRYENPVGICCPLKSVKLSRTIGKIGIFTVYKAKIGQNGSFSSFSDSIS